MSKLTRLCIEEGGMLHLGTLYRGTSVSLGDEHVLYDTYTDSDGTEYTVETTVVIKILINNEDNA